MKNVTVWEPQEKGAPRMKETQDIARLLNTKMRGKQWKPKAAGTTVEEGETRPVDSCARV